MSTWQEDMREGFQLLGEAIKRELKDNECFNETNPGQIRGLIRLCLLQRKIPHVPIESGCTQETRFW